MCKAWYKNGKVNGSAVHILASGDILSGYFKDDILLGLLVKTDKRGVSRVVPMNNNSNFNDVINIK